MRVIGLKIALLFNLAILAGLAGVLSGCKTPPVPPEVELAALQEHGLWSEGAETYAPDEYAAYKKALRNAAERLIKERARFALFRDYDVVKGQYSDVLRLGETLKNTVKERKEKKAGEFETHHSFILKRIDSIKKLTGLVNEGRLSRRALTEAEILAAEAKGLAARGRLGDALGKLQRASVCTISAMETILPILNRYADKSQIARWRTWFDEAVSESARSGSYSIVVSKIDRKLILYKGGRPYKYYDVGIGINGSNDKLYAGDKATPEGRYRIIKKRPRSRYHKALLINYPNDEDRRQFVHAKNKGLIPPYSGIGGLIEIHGGGKDGMTHGCIALENNQMDELYAIAAVGTPVTIVGATEYQNHVSAAIEGLKE